MKAYRRGFDKTKYMSFLIKDDDFLEIFGKKSTMVSKKYLIVNLYTMKNI